jgi:hypothetical protein
VFLETKSDLLPRRAFRDRTKHSGGSPTSALFPSYILEQGQRALPGRGGGGLCVPGNLSNPGSLGCETCQSGCAWWRCHVISIP